METTLHRQLKALYAPTEEAREVRVDGFRIDAVCGGRLIEVQCASLAAIRRKVETLVERHDVLVVKPLALRKLLVTRRGRGGKSVTTRYSPLRATPLNLFQELVHFVPPFPHPRLTVEIVLVELEERRVGIRARRRFRKDYRVEDRQLREVHQQITLQSVDDLVSLLPALPAEFGTEELAKAAGIPRWLAQKAAWCLRRAGGLEATGKRGRSWVYRLVSKRRSRRAG